MENTFINILKENTNFKYTENFAVAHKSSLNAVYDMFALGGAYRRRSEKDCILLFKKAFEEDQTLALKCLFYLRDIRCGQGERRYFRTCFKWLCKEYPEIAIRNLENVAEYGRYDDLFVAFDTPVQLNMIDLIEKQLKLDLDSKVPSLLAKWLASENTSSAATVKLANRIRKSLKMSHKNYRKMLSKLRERIKIVERLMSENRWNEIQFDKIPSKAGLIYRNAFARRDAERYAEFINSKKTKVNTKSLYPYEIVAQAIDHSSLYNRNVDLSDIERATLEKYWNNQKDYFNGQESKMICVCDTSGSMCEGGAAAPINIAISLSMYCAERNKGAFNNKYISFSSRPQFIEIEGVDFVDKVQRIYRTNLCENTNLEATFELLKNACLKSKPEDRPETIVVISDMEIDSMTRDYWSDRGKGNWTKENALTNMEQIRQEWATVGLEIPRLVYWNVNARNDTVLDLGSKVSLVSGASATLFESILSGKNGIEMMLEKLMSSRYEKVQ